MYIPGRSRTGSRPSRTVMSFAVYAVSAIKKALQMRTLRANHSVSETTVGADSGEARGGGSSDQLTELLILDPGGQPQGLGTVFGDDLRRRRSTPPRGLRDGVADRPGDE